MVNLKKGGKPAKKEEKSTAAEKTVSKDSDNNNQETASQPAAKRDTQNKTAAKTTEVPSRKSRRVEKEQEAEEKMDEPVEDVPEKKVNGRKRKADQKKSEDVKEKEADKEKEAESKKSKQAKALAVDSEDQSSENGKEESHAESKTVVNKTQKGRKTTEKKNVDETDKGSEMSTEEASTSGEKTAEEEKIVKRGRGAQKGKAQIDAANSEDAESKEETKDAATGSQDSKTKDVKKGARNTKAGKELKNKDVESDMETGEDDKNIEEAVSKGNAKGAKTDAVTTKAAKEQKNKAVAKAKEDKKDSKTKAATKGAKNAKGAKDTADDDTTEAEPPIKKARLSSVVSHSSHRAAAGVVLTVGEGDTGQLGLGPDIQERGKPAKVVMPVDTLQICAGGMHSVCLTVNGEVYTFGCNDEGSLGRTTKEEEECMEPGKVEIPEKIILVSAGDSHTAALSELGQVYIWGTFRDANGSIGIFPGRGKLEKPEKILPGVAVVKIASGCDHLACLTTKGDIYTMGAAEQGQLGRVAECFSVRGGRKGIGMLLVPSMVKCFKRSEKFSDIWTGSYVTFAKARDSGEIYAWGLNNYYQLGFPDMRNKFVPEKSMTFEKSKDWKEISSGQHHTVALDKDGLVYSLGRKEYGRLGLGSENLAEKSEPTLVASLQDKKCVNINCGSAVSFAVDDQGKIYGWGMGSSKQLGQGDDEEDIYEPKHITSKQLDDKRGLMVSAGGQHTIFLAQSHS